ncbi:MAG: hypothetical protein M3Q69_21005, partial [Acidobacteriota bacterium]|nr:hypothetical protein [Acidobacteriota bacterium]
MAIRKKKDSGSKAETAAAPSKTSKTSTIKRAVAPAAKKPAPKPAAAPAKKQAPVPTSKKSSSKRAPNAAAEELQAVGADVVPSVTIEADAEASALGAPQRVAATPDVKLSEAGPIMNDAPADAGADT